MLYLGEQTFGNPSSGHRFGRAARAGGEQARREVAAAVGAEPNQVIFTSGGTEADNLGIVGGALAARDQADGCARACPRSSTRRFSRPHITWYTLAVRDDPAG